MQLELFELNFESHIFPPKPGFSMLELLKFKIPLGSVHVTGVCDIANDVSIGNCLLEAFCNCSLILDEILKKSILD